MTMINKENLIRMVLLSGIFLVLLTVSVIAAGISNPQFTAPGGSTTGFLRGQGIDPFPIFNQDMCKKGQDFILQVSPFGCTPSVVRSDLLEEQNVPVYCQISATQINPLIDIESIRHI